MKCTRTGRKATDHLGFYRGGEVLNLGNCVYNRSSVSFYILTNSKLLQPFIGHVDIVIGMKYSWMGFKTKYNQSLGENTQIARGVTIAENWIGSNNLQQWSVCREIWRLCHDNRPRFVLDAIRRFVCYIKQERVSLPGFSADASCKPSRIHQITTWSYQILIKQSHDSEFWCISTDERISLRPTNVNDLWRISSEWL